MVVNRPLWVQICSQESAMSKNKSAACFNQRLGAPLVNGLFPYSIRPRSCFQSCGVGISWYIPFHKGRISEPPVVKRPKINQEVDWSLFVFHLGEQTWATQKLNLMSLFWWVYKKSNHGIWNDMIVDFPFLESVNGCYSFVVFWLTNLSTLESPRLKGAIGGLGSFPNKGSTTNLNRQMTVDW